MRTACPFATSESIKIYLLDVQDIETEHCLKPLNTAHLMKAADWSENPSRTNFSDLFKHCPLAVNRTSCKVAQRIHKLEFYYIIYTVGSVLRIGFYGYVSHWQHIFLVEWIYCFQKKKSIGEKPLHIMSRYTHFLNTKWGWKGSFQTSLMCRICSLFKTTWGCS